jgi:transcriptional regulator with XRE-family HTH domain
MVYTAGVINHLYSINGLYSGANLPSAPNDEDTISAAEIRTLADAMGCRTQAELAQRLGVTQPRVSQILSGAHPVRKGPLMQLIRTLQATHLETDVDTGTSAKQRRSRSVRGRTSERRSQRT